MNNNMRGEWFARKGNILKNKGCFKDSVTLCLLCGLWWLFLTTEIQRKHRGHKAK